MVLLARWFLSGLIRQVVTEWSYKAGGYGVVL